MDLKSLIDAAPLLTLAGGLVAACGAAGGKLAAIVFKNAMNGRYPLTTVFNDRMVRIEQRLDEIRAGQKESTDQIADGVHTIGKEFCEFREHVYEELLDMNKRVAKVEGAPRGVSPEQARLIADQARRYGSSETLGINRD